jgi:predicted amidophosphoribosyltransferase
VRDRKLPVRVCKCCGKQPPKWKRYCPPCRKELQRQSQQKRDAARYADPVFLAKRRAYQDDYRKSQHGKNMRLAYERRAYTRRKLMLASLEMARETGVSRHMILKGWGEPIGRAKELGDGVSEG